MDTPLDKASPPDRTGLLSYRQAAYDEWPRSGIPDDFAGEAEYDAFVRLLASCGSETAPVDEIARSEGQRAINFASPNHGSRNSPRPEI